MKHLIMIRHAKSSWKNLDLKDIERPLNKRGVKDAPFMAQQLKKRGLEPDLIMSSPAVRCVTTAELFAETLLYDPEKIVHYAPIYEASIETIFRVIRNLDPALNTVLIFGHNPAITFFANLFAASPIENVPTCGMLYLDVDSETWANFDVTTANLTFFDYPKRY